jgi:hypothetical protein
MRNAEQHKDLWRARLVVPPPLREHLPAPHTGRKVFLRSTGIHCKGGDDHAAQRHIDEFIDTVALPAIEHAKLVMCGGDLTTLTVELSGREPKGFLERSIIAARLVGANRLLLTSPPVPRKTGPVDFQTIIDDVWAINRDKPPSVDAREDKRRHMRRLFAFIDAGHTDMSRVETPDIQRYKEHLFKRAEAGEIERNTARDALIHIKALFTSAVENLRLDADPGATITIPPKYTKPGNKRRIYGPAERKLILERASIAASPLIRWSIWIAAFTGAITEEIVEADSRDVEIIDDDIVIFHIRLDHRSKGQELKTEFRPRPVPLHPAILKDGEFVRYVRSLPPGPLFPELPLDRKGRRATRGSTVLMAFLRKTCGIVDPRKDFYSWRHTFKTICREAKIEEQYSDAITGHANGSVAREYGVYPMPVLLREIEKIGIFA